MKKVNRLIMINILKEIGILSRTYGKESNPYNCFASVSETKVIFQMKIVVQYFCNLWIKKD